MAFFDNIKFPFFTMQELNLDWILKELKRIAGFMPQDGNVGDVLTRKSDGAEWEPPDAVNININGLPEDTAITDNDQLVFYDISASANRKIKPPNLLDSMMSNGTPLMDGTASAGTSKKPARYDHKHPTDTSRQAALSGTQMNAVNSGAAANSFVNGILKLANGGTGADNVADALKNFRILFDELVITGTENILTKAKQIATDGLYTFCIISVGDNSLSPTTTPFSYTTYIMTRRTKSVMIYAINHAGSTMAFCEVESNSVVENIVWEFIANSTDNSGSGYNEIQIGNKKHLSFKQAVQHLNSTFSSSTGFYYATAVINLPKTIDPANAVVTISTQGAGILGATVSSVSATSVSVYLFCAASFSDLTTNVNVQIDY